MSADFSIADPWLKRYVENDNVGSSIVISHTNKAEELIQEMIDKEVLNIIELLTEEETVLSQKDTFKKKHLIMKYKTFFKPLRNFFRTNFYKKYFFNVSKYHRWLWDKIMAILKRYEGLK